MCHFENPEFLQEIEKLQGGNVWLLLADGSFAFGRFGQFLEGRVQLFSPLNVQGITCAWFRSSGITLPDRDVLAKEVILDAGAIVQAIQGRFVERPVAVNDNPIQVDVFIQPEYEIRIPDEYYVRQLVGELKRFEGRNIAVRTVGFWQTGGRLLALRCGTAWLRHGTEPSPPIIVEGAVTVFGPEVPSAGVVLSDNFVSMINLRALTGLRVFRI